MKIKERVCQFGRWAKEHPGQLAIDVLAVAGFTVGGYKLVKIIGGQRVATKKIAELPDKITIPLGGPVELPKVDLNELGGVMHSFYRNPCDDLPEGVINNVKLSDMGALGEKIIEGAKGIIDPTKDTSMMIVFNLESVESAIQ